MRAHHPFCPSTRPCDCRMKAEVNCPSCGVGTIVELAHAAGCNGAETYHVSVDYRTAAFELNTAIRQAVASHAWGLPREWADSVLLEAADNWRALLEDVDQP